MQPENDTQAVRRVLARYGITAAALTLSLGAVAPAYASHGGGGKAGNAGSTHGEHAAKTADHADTQHDGTGDNTAGDQGSDNAGWTQGGSAGTGHGQSGAHGNRGGATNGGSTDSQDPAGNNGTVKIHDVAGDPSHHNVPHVDCDFWVPMWGFDAGQDMTVSFAGQAPTGKDTPVTFTALNGTTLHSPDAAGGGNDFDGELGFTTTAESLQSQLGAPQPQQGYHVKLTVATGAPGGFKYKVFWINCPAAPTVGGTTGGGSSDTGGGGDTSGGDTPATGGSTAVLGERFTRGATPGTAAVLGTRATAPTSSTLPFTGAEIAGLAAAAAAALGGGAALTAAGRRRRRGAHRLAS